jgi:transportin-1
MSNLPPPPNGQVLSLVSALSNPENHDLHLQAIRARDQALGGSPDSYGNLCLQLSYLLVGSDQPEQLLPRIDPQQLDVWRQTDMATASRLQSDPNLWIPFGQMAGLILKNALLRPPILADGRSLSLQAPLSDHVKETLLFGLSLHNHELQNVISSIIATCSVSDDAVQPYLHIARWPLLFPTLLKQLQQQNNTHLGGQPGLQGSLSTIRKMMEDGPREIPWDVLDELVPLLLNLFQHGEETVKVSALQALVACLAEGVLPSQLVLQFSEYFQGLSSLAGDPSPQVRKWVCRSINTLLECHTMYLAPHLSSICPFMLQQTINHNNDSVAIEACEFWLLFANLEEGVMSGEMYETVEELLPQLIPILLQNMVYTAEQQIDLVARNELDIEEGQKPQEMKPVFHRTRNKHGGEGADDDDDDDDDMDDDDDNEWSLRKYSGASLDSLANLYGAEPVLPCLLPALQQGLSSQDQWVQEASILALGAIADGCREEMSVHLGQLYPYLMQLLAQPETPQYLPQVKSICAWAVGRYATWAVEQVQTGAQGHLLAHMTEVFLQRLTDKNRRVQVACGSGFGVLMETAGDLMIPYLEPIYISLAAALQRYQGRSLIILFDTLGIMADYCGPAIGEGDLPKLYIPSMLHLLDRLLVHDPTNRTVLPLMEGLGSIALTCGMNFQPYALETFEITMCLIEQVQLLLAASGDKVAEEDADPIIGAADLLDGLCEGLGGSFATLVASSDRYGQHFTSVVHALCKYNVAGVRMSGLALLGDLTRNCPSLIEPVFPQLLQEAINNLDPLHPQVCNNAVWAIGEICVKCGENPAPLEPFAATLIQQLIALLMGNGSGRGSSIPGLAENAASCAGRLAKVNPNFVAGDLPRFLLGWCDGMAKIMDPIERRDAFIGFSKAVYANPQAIQQSSANVADAISSILYAIVSWHMPPETPEDAEDLLTGDYGFQPFPQTEAELGSTLAQLMRDIKSSVGEDTWKAVQGQLPVNVRRLLREAYQL